MSEKERIVRSACRGCHGVCQVLIHMQGDRVVKVTGDPDSPTSRGYLCPKGAAAPDLLYHPDRLTHPLRRKGQRGENRWERITWDEALDEIVERFSKIKNESGSEYVAMAQGTGRPYMNLSPRFANAFGTPNYVGVGHICYIPRWFASFVTLGQLPITDVYGFGGVDPSCVVIWGCNITETGASDGMCGGMVLRALKKAKQVIVVDPRRIKAAGKADHWLQIRPGTDCALALAMIHTMIEEDLYDHEFVENYTLGFDKLAEHVKPFTPEWASKITHLDVENIREVTRTYAAVRPACIMWGNALDMSACNIQTARAILILMGLGGNIDKPGGMALWVPPSDIKQQSLFMNQDAMGGRFMPQEKTGRAVTAGKFSSELVVQPPSFWRSIVTGDPYRVRAMWILGSNPLLTHTNSLDAEKALKDFMEFTVVSDMFMTPTVQLADIVLPAASWLETDDVVNLHKIWCVLPRKKVAQIGEAKDDKEVMIQLAKRLGLSEAFPWDNFREYLDWVLADSGMTFEAFCDRGIVMGEMRYEKYKDQGFGTGSGKFEFYNENLPAFGLAALPTYKEPSLSPVSAPDLAKDYPLILTAGRAIRNFFHSEGRQIESLRKGNPDPLVQIHPETAASSGILDGDWVWIETPGKRRIMQRAELFDGIAPDNVNAQYGWWFPEADPPEYDWKKSSVNLLFGEDGGYDPETGSECLRSSLCRIYPVENE
ncbi:MAG: molybdopterin-dependent oxidoreductase [Deltaproteobacteria bacterium]|nr:molybdopterin-dependent oxidoreductase [Deltaproteobacteria bacterium]